MQDAFGVERPDLVSKASWTGKKGDKRNTKYFGAGLTGDVVGSAIGRGISGRGTGWKDKSQKIKAHNKKVGTPKNTLIEGSKGHKALLKDAKVVSRVGRAGIAGGLAGGVAANAAYYAYRQSDQSKKNRGVKAGR